MVGNKSIGNHSAQNRVPAELWLHILEHVELNPIDRADLYHALPPRLGGLGAALGRDSYWRHFSPQDAINHVQRQPLVAAFQERIALKPKEAVQRLRAIYDEPHRASDGQLRDHVSLLTSRPDDFDVAMALCRNNPRLFDVVVDPKLRREPTLVATVFQEGAGARFFSAREIASLSQTLAPCRPDLAASMRDLSLWLTLSPQEAIDRSQPHDLVEAFNTRWSSMSLAHQNFYDQSWMELRIFRRSGALTSNGNFGAVPEATEAFYDMHRRCHATNVISYNFFEREHNGVIPPEGPLPFDTLAVYYQIPNKYLLNCDEEQRSSVEQWLNDPLISLIRGKTAMAMAYYWPPISSDPASWDGPPQFSTGEWT